MRHYFFVPPFIIDKLAGDGIEEARNSVILDIRSRDRRNTRAFSMKTLKEAMEPLPGTSSRKVYDCLCTLEQRKELRRGEGDPATGDDVVRNCYENVGKARDWLNEVINRKSIDNRGMNLCLNVHYGEKYMNAFWDGDEMTFGDGDGEIFVSFVDSLDVVAHELGHGVTDFTGKLIYKDQPGALNEHFSDVFGSVITQWAEGTSAEDADWLVGDEIMGPELRGEALRSMAEPGTAYDNDLIGNDPQPGHMKDYYKGSDDYGGVHINSGIPNKAFYLAAMDIGTDKAAQIWYHTLQTISPTAGFKDAAKKLSLSARILAKNEMVPRCSPQTVRAAFRAVGLY
jgi:Zn-dependent metalloprotease